MHSVAIVNPEITDRQESGLSDLTIVTECIPMKGEVTGWRIMDLIP